MAVKNYDSHRKCSTEGCFKYAVKEGMCTRCFNKAHGIEKHRGRKPKNVTAPAPPKIGGELGGKAAKKSRGNGSMDDIMLKLINVKSEYQQKLSEIDNAIEVLKKYA